MAEIQITLEAARVNAGLTQAEMAVLMKVDRSTVRRWEKGDKIPNYDETKEISRIYGIPIDNIFFGKISRKKRDGVIS